MRRLPIVRESRPLLAGLGLASLGLACWRPAAALPPLAALGFLAWFFRDPERRVAATPGAILAPADGRVLSVDEVGEGGRPAQPAAPGVRVSIFLSLLDVHVNRSPIDGRVRSVWHQPGSFHPAFVARTSAENERNGIDIEGDHGEVWVIQIAGVLARRIACWVHPGDAVPAGQRIGLIRFGSRTELLLPLAAAEVLVRPGDRVKAGQTVVARWT